ncbi:unnamed protein product [Cuscuta campestris]|uniref:Uncharacterized protein n=1 Tax=Cuscuta campestris TaxID=132261 RepID=A0A484L8H3_9ASTE|nr:unnamed protein product [Cuscuta campestris]
MPQQFAQEPTSAHPESAAALTSSSKAMMEDMCSAEEVVQALLDHFVEPFLPSFHTGQAPTPSQHQAVARQMHAVVLLYNYFHRKQYREHAFLDFMSFCKLAIVLKPSLMAYMKLMDQVDCSMMDDFESKLSQTEEAIFNACNISSALDASKNVPVTGDWPVSKVAVFLVNSGKEKCMLLDTNGVISVIEKDLEVSSDSSVGAHDPLELKCGRKQKGAAEVLLNGTENNNADARLLDWAFFAVESVAAINRSDLVVLESHIVYSLNKPKTAARLYLMQSTQCNNDDIQVHIKDIIQSLQGPLVKRSLHGWMVTPQVKYFHMLPYMEALSDWVSREVPSNGLLNQKLDLILLPSTNDQTVVKICGKLIPQVGGNSNRDDVGEKSLSVNPESRSNKLARKNDSREFQTVNISEQVDGPVQMDVHDPHAVFSKKESESQNSQSGVKVYHRSKKNSPLKEDHRCALSADFVTEEVAAKHASKPIDGGCNNDMLGATKYISNHSPVFCCMQGSRLTMDSPLPQTEHHGRVGLTITPGKPPPQAASSLLYRLRQKLYEQLEWVEAEILQCDKDIQAALNETG